MQGNTGQQGNQNGQKQGGLSWTQTPSANTQASAKPISQVQSPLMPAKAATAQSSAAVKNTAASASNNAKKETKRGGAGRTTGIFVAGVIVGLIIGWGWFSLGDDTEKVAATDTATKSSSSSETASTQKTNGAATGSVKTTPNVPASTALTVPSAQNAGLQVAVSNIAVAVPTWVVIFESSGGKPGNALGAKMFFPGENSGVVELLRATVAGQTYYAGEYIDDGDHIFSKQNDTQVMSVTGAPMFVEFYTR
jgi:hypothetical protein